MSACTCEGNPTGIYLCASCSTTMAYAVANIAAYWADLETVQTKAARYGDGASVRGSVGKERPLPIDLRFAGTTEAGTQLRYDTWATVVAWCRVVMEEQPQVHGPVCGEPCLHASCHAVRLNRWPEARAMRADGMRAMCLYLDKRHRWIEGREWAEAMLGELLDVERRLKRVIDRPPDRWYAGKCDCGEEMYAVETKAVVVCRECQAEYDVATRRDFLLHEAQDYLVTATEAASALLSWTDYDGTVTKLVDRIRKWRDRDQLEVADVTSLSGRDRHLYRLGDVQALLVRHAQTQRLKVVEAGG